MSNQPLGDSCVRLLQNKFQEMHPYSGSGTPETSQSSSYLLDLPYRSPLNGHPSSHSPNSSTHGSESATLLRQKQPPAQQVTTVTKMVREVHHLGADNPELDYISTYPPDVAHPVGHHHHHHHHHHHAPPHPQYGYLDHGHLDHGHLDHGHLDHGHLDHGHDRSISPVGRPYNDPYAGSYQDYDVYGGHHGPTNDYGAVYGSMSLPSAQYQHYDESTANYVDHPHYNERPPTPPTPSDRSESPPTQQLLTHDYMRKGSHYSQSGYDELDTSHMIPRSEHFRITPSPGAITDRFDQMSNSWNMEEVGKVLNVRQGFKWRDPNFPEVISFLSNPSDEIKANAAAYLQHLCYMDDPNKQKTGSLGGIPPLVKLLNHDNPLVYRNACGALRNLSYGRQNDENKRLIKSSNGIPLLINLLRRSTDPEVQELVTGILWNLSSCEDIKKPIIDDGLCNLVNHVVIPHSGWNPTSGGSDTCWSVVFRNTSGAIRNVSSAGEYARKNLRDCVGLIDSLFYVVRNAIDKSNIGNKSVENCVCILRNLSYRCQEVEDPNYDKNPVPPYSRAAANGKGENLGCFGASRKKRDGLQMREAVGLTRNVPTTEPITGVELLWQPEVVHLYLTLLQSCSNPETLEAAAGAIQNLAACYWQPSIEIRAAVRKEKGLPILVELLRMEVDRVVCAVATALRNLAIDQRNKELIGKYAMRDLVQKLPSGNQPHDQVASDDTIAAVLATLNEVIKKNAEFSRSLLEAGGVERLMNISKQRQRYTARVLKFSGQVLFTMWQHPELREVYKKHGWKEADFVTKTVAARNAGPNSPGNANSTLNRPMASQGGTRYEDRTMQRPQPIGESSTTTTRGTSTNMPGYQMGEDIPLADMSYPEGSSHMPMPPPGGVRIFPPGPPVKLGEPVYAQVNREKKKNRQYEGIGGGAVAGSSGMIGGGVGSSGGASAGDNWVNYEEDRQMPNKGMVVDPKAAGGGDSWV